MTYANLRNAAEHIARTGAITPQQLAAFSGLNESLSAAQQQAFTDLWRAEGSPAAKVETCDNTWAGVTAAAKLLGAKYPELVGAQWALESGFGKHLSGKHNYFGLKGTGNAAETDEFINNQWVTITDNFLNFPDLLSCIRYLVERWYLDYRNYKGCNNAPTRNDAAKWLKKDGYATAPAYANKLIKLMNEHAPASKPSPAAGAKLALASHMTLTRTGRVDSRGLHLLQLQMVVHGSPMEHLLVVSGAPGRQSFRTGRDSLAGSLEPIPEGQWGVENIVWKAGRDNYNASWGEGLGPASVPVNYQAPGTTRRRFIEIHYDENHGYSPGTAGCIGIRSIADLKSLVEMLRAHDPKQLFVDWGLGTCPKPV